MPVDDPAYVSSCTTTLHVTLLTSHYAAAAERDEAAATAAAAVGSSGNAAGAPSSAGAVPTAAAGHRRETAPSSKPTAANAAKTAAATGVAAAAVAEGVETFGCRTSAEQLDSVARLLSGMLRLRAEQFTPASAAAVADCARRIQMAKAVRDEVVSWVDFAAAAQVEGTPVLCLPPRPSGSPNASRSNAAAAAAAQQSSAGGKKGANQRAPAGKGAAGGAPQQSSRPRSARSSSSAHGSDRSSVVPAGLAAHQLSDAEQALHQTFLSTELPPCELIEVPGVATAGATAAAPSFAIFVYRLVDEDEVLATLAAVTSEATGGADEKKDATAAASQAVATPPAVELTEGEKRDARAAQAATVVTRAMWRTVRPVIRDHLRATGGSAVPAHVSVVWAMSDPRLLAGFLPSTTDDAAGVLAPCPCPIPASPPRQHGGAQESNTVVERWVRMVPRTALYLYDPAPTMASSAAVQATLTALQTLSTPGGLSSHPSPMGRRRSSGSNSGTEGKRPGALQQGQQRGGGRAAAGAASKAARGSTSNAAGAPGSSKGRSGRGGGIAAAAAASAAAAGSASSGASGTLRKPSLPSRQLNTSVDFRAPPAEFAYCVADARSLAWYLYAGGEAAAASAGSPKLAADITARLCKLGAFHRAVLAAADTETAASPAEEAVERRWRAHAPLLQWAERYLMTTSGGGAHASPRTEPTPPLSSLRELEEAVRGSLSMLAPAAEVWPLPVWEVAAAAIPPVPTLALRSSGLGDDGAAALAPAVAAAGPPGAMLMEWATAVIAGVRETRGTVAAPLVRLQRIVQLITAYNGWTLKNCLDVAWAERRRAAATATTTATPAPIAISPSLTDACAAPGVFTVANAVCAIVAVVSETLTQREPTRELTALCPGTDPSAARGSAGGGRLSNCGLPAANTSPIPSGLFRRYAWPFQTLLVAGGGGGKARMNTVGRAGIVPRAAKSGLPGVESFGPTGGQRCLVTVSSKMSRQNADVTLAPYSQEVAWMVRNVVARNAGRYELNVFRGTDTIMPAVIRAGPSSTVQDITTVGSSALGMRQSTMATWTVTTPSTGLLHQQQQRRRQRRQPSGTAAKLQPFAQGVHIIREVSRVALGRRPVPEASVVMQNALESTLATPALHAPQPTATPPHLQKRAGGGGGSSSGGTGSGGDALVISSSGAQWVSALELLQRYLLSVDPAAASKPGLLKGPSPPQQQQPQPQQPRTVRAPGAAPTTQESESEMLATQAAAANLAPRVYEHMLQQALLSQLLRETELEPAQSHATATGEDWNVTQQLQTQAIVTTLIDYRERFGAHNVSWRSCLLDYNPATFHLGDGAGEEATDEAVLRTSAYAHNALNVHPARRVTHMWVAGVAVPGVPKKAAAPAKPGHSAAGEGNAAALRTRGRSRRWVDMVQRAGTRTSVEVYALWRTLLEQHGRVVDGAGSGNTSSGSNDGGSGDNTIATSTLRMPTDAVGLSGAAMQQLLARLVSHHPEVSTFVADRWQAATATPTTSAAEAGAEAGARASTSSGGAASPMRFDTHETLYPYGSAVLEVWVSEVQRMCRYIKATEVAAALHATAGSSGHNLHLSVGFDDGLKLTCTSAGTDSKVPRVDVVVTLGNMTVQRLDNEARLRLRRYPNTSSTLIASASVIVRESSGVHGPMLPQGILVESYAALLEERATLHCVRHCPATLAAGSLVELELSIEREVACDVDERTGVVHRRYASGVQQLLFPSGATMVRRPTAAPPPGTTRPPPSSAVSHFCDTLVTLDGRCFVRTGSGAAAFCRVRPRVADVATAGTAGKADAAAPPFTRAESTYDAVHHCRLRSRQDGLTVVEYESLAAAADSRAGAVLARVVVFPDGTAITTVAPREARQRALVRHPNGVSASASLSSATLCAMLEELQAVEESLFGPASDTSAQTLRWVIEAPTLPRVYLAPAPAGCDAATALSTAAFAVILGDGTVLQRRWVPAAALPAPPSSLAGVDDGGDAAEAAGDAADWPAEGYRGGTVETVLMRPSLTAVRVLHQHAIATVEPADVLAAVTHASPAAYAVGQGLPFFDLARGGGVRMVDAARCVWEVRGLASAAEGPQVVRPERSKTYDELLRSLVSDYYSPHRLPRAAQLTYAREQLRETAAYARRRTSGWCPTLLRRLRELAEPFIRAAQLLRIDVLAPMEAAAKAAEERVFFASGDVTGPLPPGLTHAGLAALQRVSRVSPACFGQLDNGEAVRYWHLHDVQPTRMSTDSAAAATAMPSSTTEPHVMQRMVPVLATGSMLGYIGTAPEHAHSVEAISVLLCGQTGARSGDDGAYIRRMGQSMRLMGLCVGSLAPAIPPAILPLPAPPATQASSPTYQRDSTTSYATSLPPLNVLLHHGNRWLPANLQPPQQYGLYHTRQRTLHGAAAEGEHTDVVWVNDGTAVLGAMVATNAYDQYVLDQVNPFTAVSTSSAALQREVVRRELHRHEQLAQLSHYHRVLSSQWPMELPASAREEQVRLETRFEELQRGQRAAAAQPQPPRGERLSLPSTVGVHGASERMVI